MGKILYIMPVSGMPEREVKRRCEIMNSYVLNKDNQVIIAGSGKGPQSIESSIEGDLSIKGMLQKLIELKGNFDAVIIGCADDPGLFSIRELLDVPVIAPMETSIAISRMLGDQFGYITTSEESFPETRMIFRKYGADRFCASIRSMDVSVQDLMQHKITEDQYLDKLEYEIDEAINEGATTILLGCMSMAFMMLDKKVKDRVYAPIINPVEVSVQAAEMFMSLHLVHSPYAYPKPNMDKLRQFIMSDL